MSTLILQARGTIAAPKYGKIIDFTNGLQIKLDARDLGLAQGALVDNWIGSGGGTIGERSFNTKIVAWSYPTFDAGSRKSVRFSGDNLILNQLPSGPPVSLSRASYIVVAKFDDLNPAGDIENRLFTGDFGTSEAPSYHAVHALTGKLKMDTFDKTDGVKIAATTNWFVGVFVFDGANSKMMTTFDNTLVANPIGASTQERISLGGNVNRLAPAGKGMKGNIAFFAQYNRALSDREITAAIAYYKNEFAI